VSDQQISELNTPGTGARTGLFHRPAMRWAVPGAVVAIVLGAASITAVTADAAPSLPPRTASELLVDMQNASLTALSGTVVQDAALGLPELPIQVGGQGSSSFSSLVSGTHTLRVWYGGEDRQRIALLGTLGESDLVRNGQDVWTWDSDSNAAEHFQLPAVVGDGRAAEGLQAIESVMTPQQLADMALAAVEPTTTVTADGTVEVADRSAYELVLAPKDTASLVGSVRIAVDAEQHIPLRVQVFAKGAPTPAFQVGFSQVSFELPAADNFEFTPPPGATVTESKPGETAVPDTAGSADPGAVQRAATAEPKIVGKGWTSVLVAAVPAPEAQAPEAQDPATEAPATDASGPGTPGGAGNLGAIVGSLPAVSGDWGSGRLLESALFSVLITDDGRVIAGAVAPEALYRAAAQ
jgi:outer membrane lipoprotein-sorting protein